MATWEHLGGEYVCHLTTIGRVSGRPRRIEIWFAIDGPTLYILSGGSDRADWVRNARRTPEVRIEIGSATFVAGARAVRDADEDERARRLVHESTRRVTGAASSAGGARRCRWPSTCSTRRLPARRLREPRISRGPGTSGRAEVPMAVETTSAAARTASQRPHAWGMLAAIDLHGCSREALADGDRIRGFIAEVVPAIDMRAHGPTHLERFGMGELEGWSAMQFIETSSITVHADEVDGRCFVDVFSCKPFDEHSAAAVARCWFGGTAVVRVLLRGA